VTIGSAEGGGKAAGFGVDVGVWVGVGVGIGIDQVAGEMVSGDPEPDGYHWDLPFLYDFPDGSTQRLNVGGVSCT